MIVYKKVRLMKDGTLKPLFIGKDKPFVLGEWMLCEYLPTKGFASRSLPTENGTKIGGWHCCYLPIAPHLADTLSNGEQRVWLECEADGTLQKYDRPESQGGAWLLAERIKPLRVLSTAVVESIIKEATSDEKDIA